MVTRECDLAIVGGGPAGIAAAINGASEGLKVFIFDSTTPGGQASESSLIENYPGFPDGVSGANLMAYCVMQARKFGTEFQTPTSIRRLTADARRVILSSDEGEEFAARAAIISTGLTYRKLEVSNIGGFLGRGVYYGTPGKPAQEFEGKKVLIVGGANSAGQAAMDMARYPGTEVTMLVRKDIAYAMSTYLIERIRKQPNITVIEGAEVVGVDGRTALQEVSFVHKGLNEVKTIETDYLLIFIGAQPKTRWLGDDVARDQHGFVMTGLIDLRNNNAWKVTDRDPYRYETSMPGVFACGDVRSGSTKRVVSAMGEGGNTLSMCHRYFASLNRE